MQCPNDGAVLTMSERSGIEIDYCPTCRGVWLDRGELDKIIERSLTQPGARARPRSSSRSRRSSSSPTRRSGSPTTRRSARRAGSASCSTESPMEYVEIARAESERGELVLRERRPEDGPGSLELRVNGVFVMDNVEVSTERALAREALALVDDPRAVLVGGLGLGFTMHEVLADSRVELCSVVEIEQALVDWMRDGTVPTVPR